MHVKLIVVPLNYKYNMFPDQLGKKYDEEMTDPRAK